MNEGGRGNPPFVFLFKFGKIGRLLAVVQLHPCPINPTPDPSPEKEGAIECAASPLLFRGGVGGGVDRRENEVEPNQAA